jgi:hypothetical protein
MDAPLPGTCLPAHPFADKPPLSLHSGHQPVTFLICWQTEIGTQTSDGLAKEIPSRLRYVRLIQILSSEFSNFHLVGLLGALSGPSVVKFITAPAQINLVSRINLAIESASSEA